MRLSNKRSYMIVVWEREGSLKIYQEASAVIFYIILDFLIYKYYT